MSKSKINTSLIVGSGMLALILVAYIIMRPGVSDISETNINKAHVTFGEISTTIDNEDALINEQSDEINLVENEEEIVDEEDMVIDVIGHE
jgi:hypothetical protein